MKNIALIFIALFLLLPTPVFAITSTASATPSTPTPTTLPSDASNLETKIQNYVQQNLATAEAKIKEKVNQLNLVGYVGKVTSISNSSVTINSEGELFQVVTTDNTAIVNGNQKIKLSSIAIGDNLIVIGTLNTKNNILDAKRIVEIDVTVTDYPVVYVGKITTVDVKKNIVTLQTSQNILKLILSKKANLKIIDFTLNGNVVTITHVQDAGIVITKAKIL